MGEIDCTSQLFKIAERPPTTDLRGKKTSEDSVTALTANFAASYAADFPFDLPSSSTGGLVARFECSNDPLRSGLDRNGLEKE